MTRYARSKGSKSSNERLPNDPTPWHIMKQQLKFASDKKQEFQTKIKTAQQLLAKKEDLKSLKDINTDWAIFENNVSVTNNLKNSKVESKDQNEKLKSCKQLIVKKNIVDNLKFANKKTSSEYLEKKFNSKDKKIKETNNVICDSNNLKEKKQNINSLHILETDDKEISKSLKNLKRKIYSESSQNTDETYETTYFNQTIEEKNDNEVHKKLKNTSKNKSTERTENMNILSKRQKRNQKKGNHTSINMEENNCSNFNKGRNFYNRIDNNVPRKFQKKVAKIRDNNKHSRRKPDSGIIQVTINGMDVDIVRYDGFPIIKKDAERLTKLRKELMLKGIPISEIDAAMKLERRKCEKALARIRKQVCFHCRKAGHNLSDCPELEKEEICTGICFKCGSTEHTHYECKVNKKDEYRFAKCFICREPGHIAKQCPDNPKGLYPDGGSCKICGDVTHLKKDCPDIMKEKEEMTITLGTINNKNLESLDEEIGKECLEIKPIKKIVKI